jgi:chromosome segregation ATPase
MTVAALSQLKAAAQHHQRRSNKWKAKCRQLAQHLGSLNAELQQARLLAGAGADGAAVQAGREAGESQQQQQQQQADVADAAAAAIAGGQQEIRQLRQQLTAAQQVGGACLDFWA